MLRFAAKLYVREELTAESFIGMATEWVSTGPHFFFGKVVWDGSDEFVAQCETQKLLILKYDETVSVHLENREGDILWTSDFVLTEQEGRRVVATQLYTEQENYGAQMPMTFHRPVLLRMIMSRGFADEDHGLATGEQAIRVNVGDVAQMVKLFCGESSYFMPVVYVASAPAAETKKGLFGWGAKQETPERQVDADALAERLGGIAHVLAEAGPEVNEMLQNATSGQAPTPGSAQIFYPGGSSQFVLRGAEMTASAFETEVANAVFRTLILSKIEDEYSWQKIRYRKMAEASRNNQEFVDMCDSLVAESDAKVEALSREVNRLQNLVAMYEYRMGSAGKSAGQTLTLKCTEPEFYEKETHDFLMKTLKREVTNMASDINQQSSRKYHLLADLVENNPVAGKGDEIRDQLRQIMGGASELNRAKKKQLEDLGFTIEDAHHYKLTFNNDDRYLFISSKTSSDTKGLIVLFSAISNQLFKGE